MATGYYLMFINLVAIQKWCKYVVTATLPLPPPPPLPPLTLQIQSLILRTFRSDDSGTAGGFFAVVVNDAQVAGCSKKRNHQKASFSSNSMNYNVVKRMDIPKSRTWDWLMSLSPAILHRITLGRPVMPCVSVFDTQTHSKKPGYMACTVDT